MATEVEQKIIKQVEYYFGDINLPRDRFLQDEIKKDDGWVTLETMTKFNRLRVITVDVAEIAAALKKSPTGLIEVSEDDGKIRRSVDKPIPENNEQRRESIAQRTVYAKTFPLDSTMDDLEAFFQENWAIENLYLRRNEKREFKGSVFVTFKDNENAEKFLKAESVMYKETDIEVRKLKSDYLIDKVEEKKKAQKERLNRKQQAQDRQKEDEGKKIENEIVKGTLLHLNGFSAETSREDIKNLLQDHGAIAWVDFKKGDLEGWVRYDEENQAHRVLERIQETGTDNLELNGSKLTADVLEGEAEVERFKAMFAEMAGRREAKKRYRDKQAENPYKRYRYGKRPCKDKRNAAKAELQAKREAVTSPGKRPATDDAPAEGEPQAKVVKQEETAVKTEEASAE